MNNTLNIPYTWGGSSFINQGFASYVNFDTPFSDLNNKTVYLNSPSFGLYYGNTGYNPWDSTKDKLMDPAFAGRMIISEQKNSWASRWKVPDPNHPTWIFEIIQPGSGNNKYLYTAETYGGVVLGTASYDRDLRNY